MEQTALHGSDRVARRFDAALNPADWRENSNPANCMMTECSDPDEQSIKSFHISRNAQSHTPRISLHALCIAHSVRSPRGAAHEAAAAGARSAPPRSVVPLRR